jgi:hypothetical protein
MIGVIIGAAQVGSAAYRWYVANQSSAPATNVSEEVRQLRGLMEALTQDNASLMAGLKEHQEQIILLKRQIAGAFLVLLPLLTIVICLIVTRH